MQEPRVAAEPVHRRRGTWRLPVVAVVAGHNAYRDQRPPQVPMATGRPAAAWSRAVIPAQPGVGAAAAGE
jgi:hypothetical protein